MEGPRTLFISRCLIFMDGWINISQRPLLYVIVASLKATHFLREIKCTKNMKDVAFQFEVLGDEIKNIGPTNLIQVIIDVILVCSSNKVSTSTLESLCSCFK